MLHQPGREGQPREYVIPRERRISGQHVFDAVAGGEELQHGLNGDASTFDRRLAVADVRMNDDLSHSVKRNHYAWRVQGFDALSCLEPAEEDVLDPVDLRAGLFVPRRMDRGRRR